MKFSPYAKFYVAIIGAGLTAAVSIATPDTLLFSLLTVAIAIVNAAAVFIVPNGMESGSGRHVEDN